MTHLASLTFKALNPKVSLWRSNCQSRIPLLSKGTGPSLKGWEKSFRTGTHPGGMPKPKLVPVDFQSPGNTVGAANEVHSLFGTRVSAQTLHAVILHDLHQGNRESALTNLLALSTFVRLQADDPALMTRANVDTDIRGTERCAWPWLKDRA